MTTAYTPILKLALPVTGELNGTWGTVVNDNITSMVEQAVAGLATINTWTTNSHTLTSADGTTSESRCAMLVIDDDGAGNPSAAATVICPTATKSYIVRNICGQTVTVKTSAGTGVAVPNNQAALVFCDGTNVVTGAFNGDVVGPATATNNAIVTFDGTTGKLIKDNSGATISAGVITATGFSGPLNGTVGATTPATGAFTTASATTGNITTVNATTVDTTNLEVTNLKAKDGTSAGSIADATGVVTLASSVLTTTDINGGTIDATSIGATTAAAGSFTNLSVSGTTSFDGSEGTNGQVLTSAGTGNTPTWTTPTVGTVTSVAATAGTGISVSGSPITTSGTLTITNTAPDQTVSLTAGTGISTTGTYPNFTITNTAPSSGGTVTSVTGTAPVVSSGGTTPAISMAAATTSVNGYLTSTDWNTFNNKTSNTGTVTSVAATASTGISISGSPITTSGTLTITNTAPDQTVSLTAGTGISTSGTYPNFTITNTAPSSGGTVTSVGTTGTVNGITLTGTVTTSGTLTLGGALSGVSLTSQVSGTLPVANGGTGVTTSTGSGANVLGTSPTIADLTVSGAGGNVFSSTYTPTLTNTSGINSSTASACQFMRVGSVVTVSGQVTIVTSSSGTCNMKMTLPVFSSFTAARQAGGTFVGSTTAPIDVGQIVADVAGDRFEWKWDDSVGTNNVFSFTVTYLVV